MTRPISWALFTVLLCAPVRAEEVAAGDPASLQPVFKAVADNLGETGKLAIIRPEATGTTEDLSGLESALFEKLSQREKLVVLPPDEVFQKVGPEFAVTAEGIAEVAKKMDADAALFVRVFKSADKTELHVLLVSAEAKRLLDQTFTVDALPAGKEPPEEVAEEADRERETEPLSPEAPEPPPVAEAPEAAPRETDPMAQRRLSLAPRHRITGGGSFGVAGRHVEVGFHSPALITSDWMILEGDRPISELQLAKITGQTDIAKRVESDISSMKTIRNVGIGMTLGGFIAAGIAFPFVQAEGSEKVTAAGVTVGTGLAAGVAGLVLWLIYGPEAGMAETPYPVHHLIKREEAEKMIRSYNRKLYKDLRPPPRPTGGPGRTTTTTIQISVFPEPDGAGAAIRFSF